jgi:hypothetical protein
MPFINLLCCAIGEGRFHFRVGEEKVRSKEEAPSPEVVSVDSEATNQSEKKVKRSFNFHETKAKAKDLITQWRSREDGRKEEEGRGEEDKREEGEEERGKEEATYHCKFCNAEIETRLHWLEQCEAYSTKFIHDFIPEVVRLLPEGQEKEATIKRCALHLRNSIEAILDEPVKAHALTGFLQMDYIHEFFRTQVGTFKYLKAARIVIYEALRNLAVRRWRERAAMLEHQAIQKEMATRQHHRRFPP